MEDITKQLAEELKKGVESVYHPFLCTLPSDVTFIPAMWSDAKILEMDIQGTQTESDLRNMRQKWDVDAKKYYSESKGEGVSVADWVWARATLQARGFSFRSKRKGDGKAEGKGEKRGGGGEKRRGGGITFISDP